MDVSLSSSSSALRRTSSASALSSGGSNSVDVAQSGKGFRTTGGGSLSIEVHYCNPRRRFPLTDHYLPRACVSSAERIMLKTTCEKMIMSALQQTTMFAWDGPNTQLVDGHAKQWKVQYAKPNVTMYRKRNEAIGPDESPGLRHFVARGHVVGMTLDDIEYGMYSDTTLDERAVMTDLYRDQFLDAAVLQTYETQTDADPFHFFGIKWLATVSPVDKFMSSRDYAFVEYSKRIVNNAGEPILVKVVHSLAPDNVAGMNLREFDLVRGVMSCTTIYRYDKASNAVAVFATGHLDPMGNTKGWLTRSFLSRIAPTLVNLEHCADVKFIMRHSMVLPTEDFVHKLAVSQKDPKKFCVTCVKRFSKLKRTHNYCRACGEVVCSRCFLALTLCLPGHEKRTAEHPSAVIEEKFCFKCVHRARTTRSEEQVEQHQLSLTSTILEPATETNNEAPSRPERMAAPNQYVAQTPSVAPSSPQYSVADSEDDAWSMYDDDDDDHLRRQFNALDMEHKRRRPLGGFASRFRSRRNQDDPGASVRAAYGQFDFARAPAKPMRTGTIGLSTFEQLERSIAEQEALLRSMAAAAAQRPPRSVDTYQPQYVQQATMPNPSYSGSGYYTPYSKSSNSISSQTTRTTLGSSVDSSSSSVWQL